MTRKIKTSLKGYALMRDPLLNKGSAFPDNEREAFDLHGLLPERISSMKEQLERRYYNFSHQKSAIGKYSFLCDLQERNEVLFFALLKNHLEEMLPYIYTPTVAHAALDFSLLYTQARGIFIGPEEGSAERALTHVGKKDVDVIVVTDGSRVLGIGDVTFGSMTIAIGKSNLYVLFGGVSPDRILPVVLDFGTSNKKLLEDPLYLGRKEARPAGEAYFEGVERFVKAVKSHFPKALLQWEDFSNDHAYPLLERYHDSLCTFNDDIQGTSAVVLGALLAFCRSIGEELSNQKIVIYGAGSAGLGIADLCVEAMRELSLSEKEARDRIFLVDRNGLIIEGDSFAAGQAPFAKAKTSERSLEEVCKNHQPTILIGTSSQGGHFTEGVVRAMTAKDRKVAIFPLSNPNERAEVLPKDAIVWSQGRALIATGSPFEAFSFEGKLHRFSQCNNLAIFPSMGMASACLGVKRITKSMFLRAARHLSTFAPAAKERNSTELLPRVTDLPEIMKSMAIEIALEAKSQDSREEMEAKIAAWYWTPEYPELTLG